MDRGEAKFSVDDKTITLHQGQILFLSPESSLQTKAPLSAASVLGVIGFAGSPQSSSILENKAFYANPEQKKLLSDIFRRGKNCFQPIITDNKYEGVASLLPNASPLDLQIIKNKTELLALSVFEIKSMPRSSKKTSSKNQENLMENLALSIEQYLKDNIKSSLTLDQISAYVGLSKSYIKQVFKQKYGHGIIDHFNTLKIEEAKLIINNKTMNFTQISDELGFGSIHYFSKLFRKKTGMTLSEYSRSILQ